MKSQAQTITLAMSVMAAVTNMRVNMFGLMGGRSAPSDTQQRMRAAWEADAPRRNRLAAECAEWNKNVKRRNQRFVARQLARGRSAA